MAGSNPVNTVRGLNESRNSLTDVFFVAVIPGLVTARGVGSLGLYYLWDITYGRFESYWQQSGSILYPFILQYDNSMYEDVKEIV